MRESFIKSENGLGGIVLRAMNHQFAWPMIKRQTTGILTALGVPHKTAVDSLGSDLQEMTNTSETLFELEDWLHGGMTRLKVYDHLPSKLKQRAENWINKVGNHVLGTVLDLGGGSGEVACLLLERGHDIDVADSVNWLRYDLPFIHVVDRIRPNAPPRVYASDNSYDTVLLVTVFHHANDVSGMINEAFRVARKRVVFIESVTDTALEYIYGSWIDWFYNRVINFPADPEKSINVPCNFLPTEGWIQLIWKLTGRLPAVVEDAGFYQDLNPEHHVVFVYDK